MAEEKQPAAPSGYARVEQIAQIFGVSVRRVQQLTQEGIIKTVSVPGQGRRYEWIPTIKTYIQYLSDKAYGKGRSERESELKEQKLQADIALKESQGELHRLKTDIAAGRYIDIEEVAMDYQKFFTVFKRFALSIPTRLVSMVSDKVDPLEARKLEKDLGAEVKRMLEAFVVAGSVEPKKSPEAKEPKEPKAKRGDPDAD